MATPPDHLSPSGWNLWDQCERQWAAHYLDGVTAPVGWQAEVGTFAHRVLEIVMGSDGPRETGYARSVARITWGATPTESIARGEITEVEFKRRAWYAITGLWSLEDPAQVDVAATEREITWHEGDVPMKVIVDRVDRQPRGSFNPGLRVVDYKTGRLPAKKYQDKVKRQIAVGAMAVASQDPLAVAQAGSLLYVSADEAIHAPTTREARTETHRAAQETWAAINAACETGEFAATTGPLCAYCPIVADCPEGRSHVRWRLSRGYVAADAPGAKLVAALDAA